jgi:hypothetical protein
MSHLNTLVAVSLLLAACGHQSKPAETASAEGAQAKPASATSDEAEKSDKSDDSGDTEAGKVPTECAKKGEVCLPPEGFVKRLCMDAFPNVALYMFKKDSPWTRGYLRGKTKAWNASGGASDNSSELEFDEEVLILRHRTADTGGMQVSGASGGYDALRWDGSCVTLAKEEVTLKPPPAPKAAHIEWRYIEDPIQEALRTSEKVDEAYKVRRKECKGASTGTVSLKCVKADAKLSELIAEHVRNGGEVAAPQKLP